MRISTWRKRAGDKDKSLGAHAHLSTPHFVFLQSCYGFFNPRRFEQYSNFGWINGHSVAAFEA